MKEILLPLLTLILCETTPQPADMHAAITDVPSIADMSHADPKNWVDLPLAVDINEQTPVTDPDTEELRSSNPTEEAALARAKVFPGTFRFVRERCPYPGVAL